MENCVKTKSDASSTRSDSANTATVQARDLPKTATSTKTVRTLESPLSTATKDSMKDSKGESTIAFVSKAHARPTRKPPKPNPMPTLLQFKEKNHVEHSESNGRVVQAKDLPTARATAGQPESNLATAINEPTALKKDDTPMSNAETLTKNTSIALLENDESSLLDRDNTLDMLSFQSEVSVKSKNNIVGLDPTGHENSAEMKKFDKTLQAVTVSLDPTYYLHDDESLTEEDRLPPRSTGTYTGAMFKKAMLPDAASSLITRLPIRSIGGLQDQVHSTKSVCGCKSSGKRNRAGGTTCLVLYCECFTAATYCSERCNCSASCVNNASEENLQTRTEAIVHSLSVDPDAFRHSHAQLARIQQDYRERLLRTKVAATKKRRPKLVDANTVKKHGTLQKINTVDEAFSVVSIPPMTQAVVSLTDAAPSYEHPAAIPKRAELAAQLPPSHYTQPLKLRRRHNSILSGLAFSVAHPQHTNSKSSGKKLYHNLMLAPSKALPHHAEPTPCETSGLSDKEQSCPADEANQNEFKWRLEIRKLHEHFNSLKPIENAEAATDGAAAGFLHSVRTDLSGVKSVVDAAKTDIMTRFFQEARLKSEYHHGVIQDDGQGQYEGVNGMLHCDEQLEPFQQDRPVVREAQMKDYAIITAQETAVIQETARIIRRNARELAAIRCRKVDTK